MGSIRQELDNPTRYELVTEMAMELLNIHKDMAKSPLSLRLHDVKDGSGLELHLTAYGTSKVEMVVPMFSKQMADTMKAHELSEIIGEKYRRGVKQLLRKTAAWYESELVKASASV